MLVLWRLFGLLMRESWCWRWLLNCESVRGPLICLGGAWAGYLRRWYLPCQATVPGRWRATGCATGGAMSDSV